jgi:hypothetical protein
MSCETLFLCQFEPKQTETPSCVGCDVVCFVNRTYNFLVSDLELKLSGTETNQTGQNEDQQGIKTNQSEKK